MLTSDDLNDIEDWVLGAFPLKKCGNFESAKFQKKMKSAYGLKLLAADGISRTVYKKPYSKEVVKFSYFVHNIAEDAIWNHLKGTGIAPSLAKCNGISKGGMVLSQEYVSKELPGHRCYKFPYDSLYEASDFLEFRDLIESVFAFEGHGDFDGGDFHESNLMYTPEGRVKIIDYAGVAESFTNSYYLTFAKTNASRIRGEMNKILRQDNLDNVYLDIIYLNGVLAADCHLGVKTFDLFGSINELKELRCQI